MKWLCLILLLGTIAATLHLAPQQVEDALQQDVVTALADEQLSVVRVETDGLNMLLTGPNESVSQAAEIARSIGARKIIQRSVAFHQERLSVETDELGKPETNIKQGSTSPSSHASEGYTSELTVEKQQSVLIVHGNVPSGKIRETLTKRITSMLNSTDHIFNVTVDRLSEKPVWYLQDLPLMIPFLQWVDEGQLHYSGDQIRVQGSFTGQQAKQAFELAAAELPAKFILQKQLRVGKDQ